MSSSPDVIRTLAAILMADVANYGQLMGDDEPQTVRTLQAYRQNFIRQIESRRGRVLDAKGDAMQSVKSGLIQATLYADTASPPRPPPRESPKPLTRRGSKS